MIKYGEGKAGQHSKQLAHTKIRRMLMWIALVGALAGLAVGVPISFVLSWLFIHVKDLQSVPKFAYFFGFSGFELLTCAILGVLVRSLESPLDQLSKERLRYLWGGTTEALVAWQLEKLDNQWHLFNNIAMKGGGDIDHVLVGPGGLFAISTKAARGVYSRDADGREFLNGQPTDHVRQAQRLAMTLRNWLEARLQPVHEVKKIPFVKPVLAAPFAEVMFPYDEMNVLVVDEGELIDHVWQAKQQLSKQEVQGCVKILCELSEQHPRPLNPET